MTPDSHISEEIQYTQKIDENVNSSKIKKVVVQQSFQLTDENNVPVSNENSESPDVSKLTEQFVTHQIDTPDETSTVKVPMDMKSCSIHVSPVRVETKPQTTINKIPIQIEEPVKQATTLVQSAARLEPTPIITIQPATLVKPTPNVSLTVQPLAKVEPPPAIVPAAAPAVLVEPITTVTLAAPVDTDLPATTAESVVTHQAACKPKREQLRAGTPTALLDQSFSKTCTELYFQRDITYHKWPERKHIKVRLLCQINHQNFSIVEDNPLYDQHCNILTTDIADYIKTTRETSYIPV